MVFTLNHFWDKAGGFVDIATDLHEGVGLTLREVRRRPVEDSPYAGANAVAALCLARLHALTGNDDYRLHHDELMTAFAGAASRYGPVFAGTYHLAAELWIHPRRRSSSSVLVRIRGSGNCRRRRAERTPRGRPYSSSLAMTRTCPRPSNRCSRPRRPRRVPWRSCAKDRSALRRHRIQRDCGRSSRPAERDRNPDRLQP